MSITFKPQPDIQDDSVYDYLVKIHDAFQVPFEYPNRVRARSFGNLSGVYENTYIPLGENHMMVGPVSLSANLSCVGNLQII